MIPLDRFITTVYFTISLDVSDQNLAFYDHLKPLDTIVVETKLFHLRQLDMKSKVSEPL